MRKLENKRLHAFTLMELTLALGLSTFIILIGMYTFRVFTVQFYNYQDVNEKLFEISSLQFLLKNDASNAEWMKTQNDKLVFEKGKIKTEYIFKFSDIILRETNNKDADTFFLEHQDPKYYFKNKLSRRNFIDFVEIKCKFGDKWCFLGANKAYSAMELIYIEQKKK